MSQQSTASPLHIHTLASILDELVSGREIALNDEGEVYKLRTDKSRAAFAWYKHNPDKWSKPVRKEDVEAMVNQLATPAPDIAASAKATNPGPKRKLFLKSIRVHRFGGIQRFGTVIAPVGEFSFLVEKPVTLIEGANGSGKTSLLSPIMWCLTGYVYCSLRPPESATQELQVVSDVDPSNPSTTIRSQVMLPITPMPPADVLMALRDTPLTLDTWVELTFSDEHGALIGPVRRSVQRGRRDKIEVTCTGLSPLGLDTLACEVGTRMVGLLPYIELGTTSDLGKAVASLIGIKPLQDLAAHAARAQEKLRKDLVKDRKDEILILDQTYANIRQELIDLLNHNSSISRTGELPSSNASTVVQELADWHAHFESHEGAALTDAQAILGTSFDFRDDAVRQELIANVGPALGLLDISHLGNLTSAARLAALAKVTEDELATAEALVQKLQGEATALVEISQQPDSAPRLRLYARVVEWIKEQAPSIHDVEACPVCQSALAEKTDKVTGRPIADHLREFLGANTAILQKTASNWEQDSAAKLLSEACPALQAEMKRDLPTTPSALITSALTEELFASKHLKGCLAVLKRTAATLCQAATKDMPAFVEPTIPRLPDSFSANGPLAQTMGRLVRAVAFARWRRINADVCKTAADAIIGRIDQENVQSGSEPITLDALSLRDRLIALDRIVKTAHPISQALAKIKSLKANIAVRRTKQDRIELYGHAVQALDEFSGLPNLVEKQVTYLMKTLVEGTARWKEMLYSPAYVGAPAAIRLDVQANGIINVDAAANGVRAPAQHVGNTAELRATLMAILFALWEHLLDSRGGLALLLLDDPQELFDPPNQRRMANTIPSLAKKKAQILVTTLNPEFGRHVSFATSHALGQNEFDHRRVYAPKAVRPYIALAKFVEAVEEKRREFEDPNNQNDSQKARDYLKELRIYLEDRLCNLFDLPEPNLPKKYTLSDLIVAIRSRHKAGMDAFKGQAFRELESEPALAPRSEFLTLLNESHHGHHDLIQYNDVFKNRTLCVRVRRLVDAANEEYERWLRRDPRQGTFTAPNPPQSMRFPSRTVPVFENLGSVSV